MGISSQIQMWDEQVTAAKMDKAKSMIKKWIRSSIRLKEDLWRADWMQGQIFYVAEIIAEAFKNGKKVLVCGNGGSSGSGTAGHLVAEWLNQLGPKRHEPLPAIDLSASISTITAIANDYGYDFVYEKQVAGLGKRGDVLIGISTSGNSNNVLRALHTAKDKGLSTVLITGKYRPQYLCKSLNGESDYEVKPDYIISQDSTTTALIQETEITIIHLLVYLVDYFMFGVDYLED